ncbi:hypothetical protein LAJ19_18405 (plasmid) [Deinococcus taeanensis]|uniref:hypothetical protein n=1 Tax=Deinococcus taeanensis TaxID=2737050 RepID=UPI001CDCC347|nr:hypothetical protein [Deinococcus taeanensis]UBV45094.1 hypothetical protein LAJ19_18405 [Deinococcus taeanensis]
MIRRNQQAIHTDRAQTGIHGTDHLHLKTTRAGPVTLLTFPDQYPTGQRAPRLISTALHAHGGAWVQHGQPGRPHRVEFLSGPTTARAATITAFNTTFEAFADALSSVTPPPLGRHPLSLHHPGGAVLRFNQRGVSRTRTIHGTTHTVHVNSSRVRTFGQPHVDCATQAVHAILADGTTQHYLAALRTIRHQHTLSLA